MTTERDEAIAEATSHGDNAIEMTRTFDAPRQNVWKAWTDPQLMAQWLAPEPLTVPRSEMDFRVGGRYRLTMRDEDGNDFTSTGIYEEIEPPKRIVYSDSLDEMPSSFSDMINQSRGEAPGTRVPDGMVTVTFAESGGKTTVTFRDEFDSRATRDAFVEAQMVEGMNGSFDNLERVLGKMPAMAR